jgi:hypothetical protein
MEALEQRCTTNPFSIFILSIVAPPLVLSGSLLLVAATFFWTSSNLLVCATDDNDIANMQHNKITFFFITPFHFFDLTLIFYTILLH